MGKGTRNGVTESFNSEMYNQMKLYILNKDLGRNNFVRRSIAPATRTITEKIEATFTPRKSHKESQFSLIDQWFKNVETNNNCSLTK